MFPVGGLAANGSVRDAHGAERARVTPSGSVSDFNLRWNRLAQDPVIPTMPARASTSRPRSGFRKAMTSRTAQSALLALALVAGSAGVAAAQSTPSGDTSSPGAPAGSGSTGNGATGSGAAPSGK